MRPCQVDVHGKAALKRREIAPGAPAEAPPPAAPPPPPHPLLRPRLGGRGLSKQPHENPPVRLSRSLAR